MNNISRRIAGWIIKALVHPAFYALAGLISGIVFWIFNPDFVWISLPVAGLAILVYYLRKLWEGFSQLKWESLLLEEDFIA